MVSHWECLPLVTLSSTSACNYVQIMPPLTAGVKVLGSHKYEQGGLINFYHDVHTKLFAPFLKFVVLKLAKTLVRMENSNNTAWHKVHSKY